MPLLKKSVAFIEKFMLVMIIHKLSAFQPPAAQEKSCIYNS